MTKITDNFFKKEISEKNAESINGGKCTLIEWTSDSPDGSDTRTTVYGDDGTPESVMYCD